MNLRKRYEHLRKSNLDENGKPIGVNSLATKIGIASPRISEIEHGKRDMSLTELKAYHRYFNVSMEYLLGETNEPTTDTDVQAICDLTGLSSDSIKKIIDLDKNSEKIRNHVQNGKNYITYGKHYEFCNAYIKELLNYFIINGVIEKILMLSMDFAVLVREFVSEDGTVEKETSPIFETNSYDVAEFIFTKKVIELLAQNIIKFCVSEDFYDNYDKFLQDEYN